MKYKGLISIYQNHDEFYYIFKFKIIKFRRKTLLNISKYTVPVVWSTGVRIYHKGK